MSRYIVGMVIDRLLTDESLRVRFARDRIEALAALNLGLRPDAGRDRFVLSNGCSSRSMTATERHVKEKARGPAR
jgi:hypothetical protein